MKGLFSVKSGYKVDQVRVFHQLPSSSKGDQRRSWWSGLWKMNIPSKIKIFLWRACLDRLPTGDNLVKRGIEGVRHCCASGRDGENLQHIFWFCKAAARVWQCSRFCHFFPPSNDFSVMNTLRDCLELSSWVRLEEMVVLLWAIWGARNTRYFTDRLSQTLRPL